MNAERGSRSVDAVRRLFAAVEERDLPALLDCYHDDVEIDESRSLPYGGVYRGRDGVLRHVEAFLEAWGSYQTAAEHPLEATFVEADDGTVVALFRHRAVDPARGERLDGPEIGLYRVRDDKVVRAQMFHFDPAALNRFLDAATESAA